MKISLWRVYQISVVAAFGVCAGIGLATGVGILTKVALKAFVYG